MDGQPPHLCPLLSKCGGRSDALEAGHTAQQRVAQTPSNRICPSSQESPVTKARIAMQVVVCPCQRMVWSRRPKDMVRRPKSHTIGPKRLKLVDADY